MLFKENLELLPSIEKINAIELFKEEIKITRIENKLGSAGSVRVYFALAKEFEKIDVKAAEKGLELYAEHTEDSVEHPGKHPNIDRLLEIVLGKNSQKLEYLVKIEYK